MEKDVAKLLIGTDKIELSPTFIILKCYQTKIHENFFITGKMETTKSSKTANNIFCLYIIPSWAFCPAVDIGRPVHFSSFADF